MYTQCPQCLTYFQVTPEHLRIAQGNVRCGQCRNVFSALGNLTEEPPKSAYQDSDGELEEEIFIDEAELHEYGDEFVEEYEEEIAADEYTEVEGEEPFQEYEEEYYFVEEDLDEGLGGQQNNGPGQPLDLEKTLISPPPTSDRHNLHPQVQSPNINNKLSEAIATIERLKQSYSNLSIRKLEQNEPATTAGPVNKPKADLPPPNSRSSKQQPAAPSAEEISVNEPPSSAQIFSPFIEGSKKPPKAQPQKPPARPNDIAIERYSDDDGVNYEEALNALNELKILEEEEATDDAAKNKSSEGVIPPERTAPDFPDPGPALQNEPAFRKTKSPVSRAEKDLSLKENVRKPKAVPPKPKKKTSENKHAKPKVKPSARKGREKPKKAAKPQKPVVTTPKADSAHPPATENPAKNLPAIPKQLLEDFHPSRDYKHQSSWMNSIWGLGSLMLMLAFLIQAVYFKHNDLAQISPLRPLIETFCGYMSCTLGLPSDVKQLELVSQDIRSHPKVKNALLVTTTIINNARFAQAYPGLQITFTDLNGQKIAMRRFTPSEYLPHDVAQANGMPPNTPIQVKLEMMDPGTNAVNFEFDFIPLS